MKMLFFVLIPLFALIVYKRIKFIVADVNNNNHSKLKADIFFFILILQTHRIAGPVYVMTYYMKEFLDGRKHEHLRPLRKHDQLKDFYQLFKEFMAKINSGKTARLTAPAIKKTNAKKTVTKKK